MAKLPLHGGLVFAIFLAAAPAALALSGASVDTTDRFPFVVEIKLNHQTLCSGTLIYPRIVVTAAHCLQQKLQLGRGALYLDEYLKPSDLVVNVAQKGKSDVYGVAEIDIAPAWRDLSGEGPSERFPHDLALLITKQPIEIEAPPSPLVSREDDAAFAMFWIGQQIQEGTLVAFGGEHCASSSKCEDAGVRRFRTVGIRSNSYCFGNRVGPDPILARPLWCMEVGVMPGDSGGALFVRTGRGEPYFVGVISAQQGLPPQIAPIASWRRSVAAALHPNLSFIREKAEALGYLSPAAPMQCLSRDP